MDNLLEIIVPVIFAAIYFFGNMLSGKADQDDAPKPPRRRPGNAEDDEAAERQRKIQEEIRRKILERRQQAEGRGPVPPVVSPPPMRGMQRRQREQTKETAAQTRKAAPPPYVAPTHDMEPVAGGFTWGDSDNAYEKQMEAKLRRIEETKRQAEKLNQKVVSPITDSTPSKSKRRSSGLRLSGSVRSQLKNPGAAKAAFVYGEVLGQPISMRKQSNVPGLS